MRSYSIKNSSPLSELRFRIVRMLGSVGGQYNHFLADCGLKSCEASEKPKWMAWDRGNRLFYNVPFYDMKPRIALDSLLPRLVELSLESSDRQIKVFQNNLLGFLSH
jgi:hypothetical protein